MPLTVCSFKQYQETHPMRALSDFQEEREQVLSIIGEVRRRGDQALFELGRKFDRVEPVNLKVPDDELAGAARLIDPGLMESIRQAKENIEQFHRNQVQADWWQCEPGRLAGQRFLPLQSVGAYIPGGTAAYPSSVLMTVIPARVAGVHEIYIATPPDTEGRVNQATLAAAFEAGATAVFVTGGAQAVAAMAYGTETVPAVEKIVGPGNIYVTLAKKEVFGDVGIDMLAGPSEIVILADESATPAYIAADLLSQAEHDPLSRPILVTTSMKLARAVIEQLEEQLAVLPRRVTAEISLKEQGAVILVESLEEAWTAANRLAPEHLELHIEEPWGALDLIRNAGAVFVGEHTPEAVGDYWAGSNHVLPTGTAARYASALGVYDFVKKSNLVYYSREALLKAMPEIAALARAEGLEAHARSVLRRKDNAASNQD